MSLTGRILENRYELRELLGQGASGQVYLAYDRRLQRPLAVKVLREHLAEDETQFRRFEREATTVARLNHPNIVAVYDFGVQELSFIAMELVLGRSLARLLAEEGRLEAARALAIAEPVLAALGHAHRQGVVHRDVKPGNILLGERDGVKLTDFGIAQLAGRQGITETGMVVGTASYLSPEQAQGLPATPASDLYAVGTVLFEMLAGHPPFEADTTVAVALKHVHEPPPRLSAERPDLPASFEQVVDRALAKDPAQRFPDAESFAEALRALRTETEDADDTATGAVIAGAAGAGASRGITGPTAAVATIPPGDEVLEPTEVRTSPAAAPDDGAGRRPLWGRMGNAGLALLFIVLLLGAGAVALALNQGDGDDVAGDTGQGPSTTADATAPSEAAPPTSAPSTTPPSTDPPPETAPPTTATPSQGSGGDDGDDDRGDDGDDDKDKDEKDQSNPQQANATEVTSFGAKVRLPPGWRPGEISTSETLRTFTASGPAGATLRVDEDRSWSGGWEDLLPDAQSLEADLHAKYADMRTLSLERTEYRGARAVRWEFVYTGGSGTLHKIDLFFQKDQKTPPAAILVSWPEGSEQGESEARTVLESLEF